MIFNLLRHNNPSQWYEKYGRNGQLQYRFKKYQAYYPNCECCQFATQCLADSNIRHRHGRALERSEHEEALVANRRRIIHNRTVYRRRQAIVEHPFGTIKRSWGFYYTLLKGKDKVSGEYAIVFTVYNLRRVLSILGVKALLEALNDYFFDNLAPWREVECQHTVLNCDTLRAC